jgi:type II secretory ATPase GspE/PulE/Tfp pilus assembly ATPase PilB-like protein
LRKMLLTIRLLEVPVPIYIAKEVSATIVNQRLVRRVEEVCCASNVDDTLLLDFIDHNSQDITSQPRC